MPSPPEDPLLDLAKSEMVVPPNVPPADKGTIAFAAAGAGIGGAIAGPPGALVGGAVGWMADAVRRRWMAP